MKEWKTFNITPYYIMVCRTVCMVMASFAVMCVVLDAVFLFQSQHRIMKLVNGVGALSSVAFLFTFFRTMLHKQIMKRKSVVNTLSLIAFLFLLLAVAPILLYLLLGDQWLLVNEYGFTESVVKSLDIYYRIAMYSLLLVIITFWIMEAFTIRESTLYKKLHEKKIEIYEKD